MKLRFLAVVLMLLLAVAPMWAQAQDAVELRMTWYSDGVEGDVMRGLLDKFQEANPGITVVMDTIAYADLHSTLQTRVEGGDAPDLARINDVARFAGTYLDLTELTADADYWTTNFPAAVLQSMRSGAEDQGVYGFPLQFTITGPYVNRTLFEQAGIPVPSDESDSVTWKQWIEASAAVAAATETPYTVAIDRTGHRFWGLSLPLGATYVNADGSITVDSEGFRTAAQYLIDWNASGAMPADVWLGSGGSYVAANEYFINGQVPFYYSGSWQVAQFADKIGDTFEWSAVPNPTGVDGTRTGIPGGSVLVAFNQTAHPEEVALLMDYLASEDVLREFSAGSLFIPGHLGLAEAGVEYEKRSEDMNVFLAEIPNISEQAYALQYSRLTFVLNPEIRDRLSQVLAGELTLDEAIIAIQTKVDEEAVKIGIPAGAANG
jgi:alpha-1,4-digalacturonate transport system substrate-binding protein